MVALDLVAQGAHKVAGNLSSNLPWELANNKWAASLNPLLSNPIVNGRVLSGVVLTTGANTINHGLQRKLQGYVVILKSADVTIYDSQANNQMPDFNLILNSSEAAIVSIYVF